LKYEFKSNFRHIYRVLSSKLRQLFSILSNFPIERVQQLLVAHSLMGRSCTVRAYKARPIQWFTNTGVRRSSEVAYLWSGSPAGRLSVWWPRKLWRTKCKLGRTNLNAGLVAHMRVRLWIPTVLESHLHTTNQCCWCLRLRRWLLIMSWLASRIGCTVGEQGLINLKQCFLIINEQI